MYIMSYTCFCMYNTNVLNLNKKMCALHENQTDKWT